MCSSVHLFTFFIESLVKPSYTFQQLRKIKLSRQCSSSNMSDNVCYILSLEIPVLESITHTHASKIPSSSLDCFLSRSALLMLWILTLSSSWGLPVTLFWCCFLCHWIPSFMSSFWYSRSSGYLWKGSLKVKLLRHGVFWK